MGRQASWRRPQAYTGLPAERLESYRKLLRELHSIHVRHDEMARLQEKRRNKVLHKAQRDGYKLRPKG